MWGRAGGCSPGQDLRDHVSGGRVGSLASFGEPLGGGPESQAREGTGVGAQGGAWLVICGEERHPCYSGFPGRKVP